MCIFLHMAGLCLLPLTGGASDLGGGGGAELSYLKYMCVAPLG